MRAQQGTRRGEQPRRRMLVTAVSAALFVGTAGVLFVFMGKANEPKMQLNLKHTHAFRVFGPTSDDSGKIVLTEPDLPNVSFDLFTRDDQRDFLMQYGMYCQRGMTDSKENVILKRYDELPEPFAIELWKYCVLYTGVGNVYWQADNLVPLVLWEELLRDEALDENIAIQMEESQEDTPTSVGGSSPAFKGRLHHSFLRVVKPHSKVCLGLMRYLVESKSHLHPLQLSETLGLYVKHDKGKKRKKNTRRKWKMLTARCIDVGFEIQQTAHSDAILIQSHRTTTKANTPTAAHQCPVSNGGHCCQVWQSFGDGQGEWPTMVIRHPLVASTRKHEPQMPFMFAGQSSEEVSPQSLGMAVEELPFVATVREYLTGAEPATRYETPNFFDILMNNNCLPQDKDCFKCLKTGYNGEAGGDCEICRKECPCYCSALCQIRPPPKRLMGHWHVTRPSQRKDPHRIVPRIIHQTWFEPVTKEAYPNMSRLIESWRQAGWQYEFYDDERAGRFISVNFPPQVREAFDAILPGAFKADLFRYCVLLIRGGVYADMDILLESNLDEIIHPTVGFMVPQDSPGMTVGHRHCLWNGLMAAAPGHPFLAKTIENVVNNVRNRFTSVDYDDMLCPNPVLAVTHTVDTLFTAGPCILGASVNDVMNLHRQHGFEPGDMDIFQSEHEQGKFVVDPTDDPRFLIPGRSIILKQIKEDMGSHRFTWEDRNLIAAATDMPDYDDRPPTMEHYSKTHEKFGVYGLHKLYADSNRANEEFKITIVV
jgi:hypothetical protein